jgi:hypothetical protein
MYILKILVLEKYNNITNYLDIQVIKLKVVVREAGRIGKHNNNNNNNNNNNSILYYLYAESTAKRPITDTAQFRYR